MDPLLAAFIILCVLLISIPILLITLKKDKKEIVTRKPFAIGFINLYCGSEADYGPESMVAMGRGIYPTASVAKRFGVKHKDYYKTVAIVEVKDVHS